MGISQPFSIFLFYLHCTPYSLQIDQILHDYFTILRITLFFILIYPLETNLVNQVKIFLFEDRSKKVLRSYKVFVA